MSVLTDLEARLGESQDRIANLIQQLEHQAALEQSLKDAGQGLTNASNGIVSLAESTRTLVESLAKTQVAFQEVVAVLQRSDPVQLEREVTQIGNRVQDVREQLTVQTKEVIGAVVTGQNASTRQLTASVEEAVGSVKTEGVEVLREQLAAQTKEVVGAVLAGHTTGMRQLSAKVSKAVGAAKKDSVKTLSGQLKHIRNLGYVLLFCLLAGVVVVIL